MSNVVRIVFDEYRSFESQTLWELQSVRIHWNPLRNPLRFIENQWKCIERNYWKCIEIPWKCVYWLNTWDPVEIHWDSMYIEDPREMHWDPLKIFYWRSTGNVHWDPVEMLERNCCQIANENETRRSKMPSRFRLASDWMLLDPVAYWPLCVNGESPVKLVNLTGISLDSHWILAGFSLDSLVNLAGISRIARLMRIAKGLSWLIRRR